MTNTAKQIHRHSYQPNESFTMEVSPLIHQSDLKYIETLSKKVHDDFYDGVMEASMQAKAISDARSFRLTQINKSYRFGLKYSTIYSFNDESIDSSLTDALLDSKPLVHAINEEEQSSPTLSSIPSSSQRINDNTSESWIFSSNRTESSSLIRGMDASVLRSHKVKEIHDLFYSDIQIASQRARNESRTKSKILYQITRDYYNDSSGNSSSNNDSYLAQVRNAINRFLSYFFG